MLNLLTYPDELLFVKSEPITEINDEIVRLAKDMYLLLEEKKGLGISAVQIGMPIKLVVLYDKKVLINPEYVYKSNNQIDIVEGCLSVPGQTVETKRHKIVSVVYFDLYGIKRELTAIDLLSCILQHEMEHLEGKLIIPKSIDDNKKE